MQDESNEVEDRNSHRLRHTKRTRIKSAILAVVLVLGVALLWPAQWGGLFGIVIVNGHSMEPTFYTGDVVISAKAPSYSVGDVIAYKVTDRQIGSGGHVIHRIVKITQENGQTTYVTRGDNNKTDDPWKVQRSGILGRQMLIIPKVGSYVMSSQGGLVVGIVLAVIVIAALWPSKSKHGRR